MITLEPRKFNLELRMLYLEPCRLTLLLLQVLPYTTQQVKNILIAGLLWSEYMHYLE